MIINIQDDILKISSLGLLGKILQAEGKMVELDAASVLSIPRALKSQEVVRKGFMCNFLFRNISNVFGAGAKVREIVEKLTPAAEVQQKKRDNSVLDGMNNVSVDRLLSARLRICS